MLRFMRNYYSFLRRQVKKPVVKASAAATDVTLYPYFSVPEGKMEEPRTLLLVCVPSSCTCLYLYLYLYCSSNVPEGRMEERHARAHVYLGGASNTVACSGGILTWLSLSSLCVVASVQGEPLV